MGTHIEYTFLRAFAGGPKTFRVTVETMPEELPAQPPPWYMGAVSQHYNFHSRTNPIDNCNVGSCKDAVRRLAREKR